MQMRNLLKRFLSIFAVAFFVDVGQSHADIVITNLGDTATAFGTVGPPPQEYAQEFVTGSQSFRLGSIVANLGNEAGSGTVSGELVTRDADGTPSGTVVATFTAGSIPTSGFANVTFTPSSNVVLSNDTDYWFVLMDSGTGSFQWNWTQTANPSLIGVAVYESSWVLGSPPGSFLIEINSVPEPSSLLLIALAFPVVAVAVRRRRRARVT
jgi:hypothetical protein